MPLQRKKSATFMTIDNLIHVIYNQIKWHFSTTVFDSPMTFVESDGLNREIFHREMKKDIRGMNIDLKKEESVRNLSHLISKVLFNLLGEEFNILLGVFQWNNQEKQYDPVCPLCNSGEVDGEILNTLNSNLSIALKINPTLLQATHFNITRYFLPISNDGVDARGRKGSCGFLSLKTTREEVLSQLTAAIKNNDHSVMKKLGDQIRQEIIAKSNLKLPAKFKLKLIEIQNRINNQEKILQSIENAAREILELSEFQEYESVKESVRKEKQIIEQEFDDLIYSPDLILAYLNYNIPEEWMSVGVATAWAEVNRMNLNIWRSNGSDGLILIDGLSHFSSNDAQTIDIFHDERREHFERLQLISNDGPEQLYFPYEVLSLGPEPKEESEEYHEIEEGFPISDELSNTTKQLLLRVKAKDPDPYGMFLTQTAFKAPPSLLNFSSEEENMRKVQWIYENQFDYITKCDLESFFNVKLPSGFRMQFSSLLNRLDVIVRQSMDLVSWKDNKEKTEIQNIYFANMSNFAKDIFDKTVFGIEKAGYFETLKYMLEEITLCLMDETTHVVKKKSVLVDLVLSIKGCTPGVFSKLDILVRKIKTVNSLFMFLADFRESIILLFAEKQAASNNSKRQQSIHLYTALSNYMRQMKGNVHVDDRVLTDNFIPIARLTEKDILDFHQFILKRYVPDNIIENLVLNLTVMINDLKNQFADYHDMYFENVKALLLPFGVNAKYCFKEDEITGTLAFDFNLLTIELIQGLINENIFTEKVLETFSSYELDQDTTILYGDIFPKLSYVIKYDKELMLKDYYLLPDYLEKYPIHELPSGFIAKATKNCATYLLLVLYSYSWKLKPHVRLELQTGLNKILSLHPRFETISVVIDQLSPNQRKSLIKQDFFISTAVRELIKDWSTVKELLSLIIEAGQIDYLSKFFDYVLTEELIIQLVRIVKYDAEIMLQIADLLSSYMNYWLIFRNKISQPAIIEAASIQGLFTVFDKQWEFIKLLFHNLQPKKMEILLGDKDSLHFFVSTSLAHCAKLLLIIDKNNPSFWSDDRVEVIRLYIQGVKLKNFEEIYLKEFSDSFKVSWRKIRPPVGHLVLREGRGRFDNVEPLVPDIPAPNVQNPLGFLNRDILEQPQPIPEAAIQNELPNQQVAPPIQSRRVFVFEDLNDEPFPEWVNILQNFIAIDSFETLCLFMDQFSIDKIEKIWSIYRYNFNLSDDVVKILGRDFYKTQKGFYQFLLEHDAFNATFDLSQLKERILAKFPKHQKITEQFKKIIDSKSFLEFFGQELSSFTFNFYMTSFLNDLNTKDYQGFEFLKPKKNKLTITHKDLFKYLVKKKHNFTGEQFYILVAQVLIWSGSYKYIINWLNEVKKPLLLKFLSNSVFSNTIFNSFFKEAHFFKLWEFLLEDRDRLFAFVKSFKETPSKSLAELINRFRIRKRYNALEDIFIKLDLRELKELFPDFEAIKNIFTGWKNGRVYTYIQQRIIIDLVINYQLLDYKLLKQEISDHWWRSSSGSFLTKEEYCEVMRYLEQKIHEASSVRKPEINSTKNDLINATQIESEEDDRPQYQTEGADLDVSENEPSDYSSDDEAAEITNDDKTESQDFLPIVPKSRYPLRNALRNSLFPPLLPQKRKNENDDERKTRSRSASKDDPITSRDEKTHDDLSGTDNETVNLMHTTGGLFSLTPHKRKNEDTDSKSRKKGKPDKDSDLENGQDKKSNELAKKGFSPH